MTDLVVLSLECWDGVWRRNQHLVAGLLHADPALRVLFVEPSSDPLFDTVSRRRPRWGSGLRVIALQGVEPGRLWAYQPTKLLPRRLDPRTDMRTADRLRHLTSQLDFTDPLLWINDPGGAAVLERTSWPALYDITDDWLQADRTPAEHDRLVRDEAMLMERCAEVVVCSKGLQATKSDLREVTLIPNAVDVADYRVPRPRPADLPAGPVAVYVGTVHRDRIDLDLCIATARALGDRGWLVLVGPAPLDPSDHERLAAAGVVMLGAKDRSEVPGYLQHADVLVVPHVVTPFTESLDPIKLYEYRAVGRPVVSTPVAGFRDSRDPHVTIAHAAAFPEVVGDALPASTVFPAGADVPVDSWSARVEQMRLVIERVRGISNVPRSDSRRKRRSRIASSPMRIARNLLMDMKRRSANLGGNSLLDFTRTPWFSCLGRFGTTWWTSNQRRTVTTLQRDGHTGTGPLGGGCGEGRPTSACPGWSRGGISRCADRVRAIEMLSRKTGVAWPHVLQSLQ